MTNNAKVVKQFTKFIFPFRYDKDLTDLDSKTITTAKGTELPIFVPFSQPAQELRQGMSDLMATDGGRAQICKCYRLNNPCRPYFNLPKRPDEMLQFHSRAGGNVIVDVAIVATELFLFESGVGLVCLEATYKSASLDDYIDSNYFISEIKSDKNYFVGIKNIWNEQTKTKESQEYSFTVKDFVNSLIEYVDGVQGIDAQSNALTTEKGIIYSYLLLNEEPEEIRDLLFNVRKNFKSTYKVPHVYAQLKEEPYIKRMFENSYWASSLNGAVNLSYLIDDEGTNEFFKTDLFAKMHAEYFFLFVNVLQQRYSVLKYKGDMHSFHEFEKNYKVMRKTLMEARNFQIEVAQLKLRKFVKDPANIENIND